MMKRYALARALAASAILLTAAVTPSHAEIESTELKQLKLDVAPLDTATSRDGKWMYVLTSGEVVVYSMQDDKEVKRVPVDASFDRLSYSVPDDAIILSSSTARTVKILRLDEIHHFNLTGTPVKGPENAPITLVVFSDYQ